MEWAAEAGWFLADQWIATQEIQKTTQEMAHLSLEASPSSPSAKATRKFYIFWEQNFPVEDSGINDGMVRVARWLLYVALDPL